uniref:Uncharacterized protein n=1 Tax=Anguilla anguilla TaxID=7936 RepID=A0A0E9TNS0_ANGAN
MAFPSRDVDQLFETCAMSFSFIDLIRYVSVSVEEIKLGWDRHTQFQDMNVQLTAFAMMKPASSNHCGVAPSLHSFQCHFTGLT